MKKLKYEDIRETFVLDYRTRGVKMLEEDKDGNPYVWGFEHLNSFFQEPIGHGDHHGPALQIHWEARKRWGKERANKPESQLVAENDELGAEGGPIRTCSLFPDAEGRQRSKGILNSIAVHALPEHLRPVGDVSVFYRLQNRGCTRGLR
jgi:hypothetical protein